MLLGKVDDKGKPVYVCGMTALQKIDRGDGVRLAVRHRKAASEEQGGTTVVFLPGYMSDMLGTKAEMLDELAEAKGFSLLRFDYSGCGESEGKFDDGSIKRWAEDAEVLIDKLAPESPLVLVGSSMGGWVMLQLARAFGARVKGLVGVAAAPDFTRWDLTLSEEEQQALQTQGYFERYSPWGDDPYRYSRTFIDGAEDTLFLESEISIDCPVRLIHGQQDEEVPAEISLRLAERLRSTDVKIILIKNGDHRLSDPVGLRTLGETVEELV